MTQREPPTRTPLGIAVRNAIYASDATVGEAAEAAGISRSTMNRRITSGVFKTSELVKLSCFLGTTPADLLAESEIIA